MGTQAARQPNLERVGTFTGPMVSIAAYRCGPAGVRWDRFAACAGCVINLPAYEFRREPGMTYSDRPAEAEPGAGDLACEAQASIPMLYCPVCSKRLESRKCKLICESCGYYMSCSDFY
jgi:hypothetical protein